MAILHESEKAEMTISEICRQHGIAEQRTLPLAATVWRPRGLRGPPHAWARGVVCQQEGRNVGSLTHGWGPIVLDDGLSAVNRCAS